MTLSFRTLPGASAEQVSRFCLGTDDPERWCGDIVGCLEQGTLRPEWCWQALDGEQVLATNYWWGAPGSATPRLLMSLGRRDLTAAVALVRHSRDVLALPSAWYSVTITGGQRPDQSRPDLTALLAACGFTPVVDRVRLEWRPETGVPADPGRLSCTPARDLPEAELLALLAAVVDGSLDYRMRVGVEEDGVPEHTRQMLTHFLRYAGQPDWFVVGRLPDGTPVGYVLPATMDGRAILAELGVAAAHRGHGYAADLLAHGTAALAAAGAEWIRSDTDLANTPMRAAFARAGYREFANRFEYRWVR